jgi:hypothetical protein
MSKEDVVSQWEGEGGRLPGSGRPGGLSNDVEAGMTTSVVDSGVHWRVAAVPLAEFPDKSGDSYHERVYATSIAWAARRFD